MTPLGLKSVLIKSDHSNITGMDQDGNCYEISIPNCESHTLDINQIIVHKKEEFFKNQEGFYRFFTIDPR